MSSRKAVVSHFKKGTTKAPRHQETSGTHVPSPIVIFVSTVHRREPATSSAPLGALASWRWVHRQMVVVRMFPSGRVAGLLPAVGVPRGGNVPAGRRCRRRMRGRRAMGTADSCALTPALSHSQASRENPGPSWEREKNWTLAPPPISECTPWRFTFSASWTPIPRSRIFRGPPPGPPGRLYSPE